ncbi:hypothetical protein [Pseudoalteromonas luteoviolacea]|uniref:Uncharacterized protein n=1 Tax=Pseudoalteromonas luteoviolacea DSM 6061 TaxID=1365250 RepID=A0A166X5T3_9GAMM|nr:hypothetical protein [Pseudoalteromonas luteoviolacea]KZN39700.1 hypothetical protein N475_13130 [Pseudoalteromonas luteoviolacea DSM 6061]MBE0385630.1 hypothetical protein [Pseudoalteromonas luteoviolacea DSM 6061]
MRKIEDFLYEYEGFWKNSAGQCRIRIFIDNNDRHIGICTALPENTGTSTTNRIEHIYTDIKKTASLLNKWMLNSPKAQ